MSMKYSKTIPTLLTCSYQFFKSLTHFFRVTNEGEYTTETECTTHLRMRRKLLHIKFQQRQVFKATRKVIGSGGYKRKKNFPKK